MTRFAAVAFDLFETLVTEFVPDWRPGPSNAERLGVPQQCFAEVWRGCKDRRMTSTVDYRDVLRQICAAADVVIDRRIEETIETLGVAKPEPRIYLTACSRLGLEPEQVAFVGDGGSHELDGARRAGLSPYCARWFLDQWPRAYQGRRDEAVRDYPAVHTPEDLVQLVR